MLYLLAVLAGFFLGGILCFSLMWKLALQVAKNKDRRLQMFRSYFYTLDRWLTARRKQPPLGQWLASEKQVHTVALYGLGVLGRQFMAELEGGPVTIAYGIDQGNVNVHGAFPVYTLEDSLKVVDLVIVTPAYDVETIERQLSAKLACRIMPAETLIKEYCSHGSQS